MSQLDQYRKEIDQIDQQLSALFLQRMQVTEQVGLYKQGEGIPVLDASRERQVLAQKVTLTDNPKEQGHLADLFQSIMAISRKQQRQLVDEVGEQNFATYRTAMDQVASPTSAPKVVYQGEPGAYSEEALTGYFGEDVEREGLPWFEDVFQALKEGRGDYAVLPVENSSTGSIRQVYDLMAQYNYYLVGECQVKVEHCLMALPGVTLADIETVYSHEQGIMQCEKFLDGHRDWNRVATLDTAGSAKMVAETGDAKAAAICSRRAAKLYGLHILAESINHNQSNYTRFMVVAPRLELPEGRNKVSAMFRLAHQAGSLHEMLTICAVQGLNLLKLESRPILGQSWEYLFFVEFSGDLTQPHMDGIIKELCQLATEFRILGNFKGLEP